MQTGHITFKVKLHFINLRKNLSGKALKYEYIPSSAINVLAMAMMKTSADKILLYVPFKIRVGVSYIYKTQNTSILNGLKSDMFDTYSISLFTKKFSIVVSTENEGLSFIQINMMFSRV